MLFLLHRPPLVIQLDNDSAFKIADIEDICLKWGVIHLWSPGYCAKYNGSCETGNGTLKTYTHHEAARHDRPGEWTCDDLDAARLWANALARPSGRRGSSPDEAWNERTPITLQERIEFYQRVEMETTKRNVAQLKGVERAAAERKAIAAALVAFGYLLIRRRQNSPLFKSKFWTGIS